MMTVIVLGFLVAMVLLVIGLIAGKPPATASAPAPGTGTPDATTPPAPTGPNIQKGHGGIRDPLQILGLAYDTPNLNRIVVTGNENEGPIVKIIPARGYEYDPRGWEDPDGEPGNRDMKIRKMPDGTNLFANESTADTIARVMLGRIVFGWPLINHLRPLHVDYVVERPTDPTRERSVFETLYADPTTRYGLYQEFQRPIILASRDTGNKVRFTVKVTLFLEVLDPMPIATIYRNNFLQVIDSQTEAFMKEQIVTRTYDEYLKRQVREFIKKALKKLNDLLRPLGLKCKRLTTGDPELNAAIQEAFDAEATADAYAKVTRKQTDARAYQTRTDAQAQKDASIAAAEARARGIELETAATEKQIKAYAAAHGQEVVEIFNGFKGRGFSDADAQQKTHEQILERLRAEAIKGFQGDVYAPGGGMGVNYNTKTTPGTNNTN